MYQPEEKFRICSYNVASLRTVASQADHHYGSLGKWLQHIGADIACFQEVKLTDKNLDKSLALADGYETFWALSNTRKGYSGVATFVRDGKYSPIDAKKQMFEEESFNEEGRCLLTDHGEFAVFNVYVPNAGERPARERLPYKLRFLRELRSRMDEYLSKGKHVVLAGDLNVAHLEYDVSQRIRRENPEWHGYSEDEIRWFDDLVGYGGDTIISSKQWVEGNPNPSETNALVDNTNGKFVDTYRAQNRRKIEVFTCWDQRRNHRAINDGVRIDYIITSKEFYKKYVLENSATIHNTPGSWSDHVMISVDCLPPPAPEEHAPCALSSKRDPRFKPMGRSLFNYFGASSKSKSPKTEPSSKESPSCNRGAVGTSAATASTGAQTASFSSSTREPCSTQVSGPLSTFLASASHGSTGKRHRHHQVEESVDSPASHDPRKERKLDSTVTK
eukprot:gb/GECG01015872.1/.p1 GENE.gb/GECG01015872.1/~~gb/GECG01015872.1/.p1  ORF type:complete len:446 (+),score=48.57 gb/GECG01015872.1/:1-1338(+)